MRVATAQNTKGKPKPALWEGLLPVSLPGTPPPDGRLSPRAAPHGAGLGRAGERDIPTGNGQRIIDIDRPARRREALPDAPRPRGERGVVAGAAQVPGVAHEGRRREGAARRANSCGCC